MKVRLTKKLAECIDGVVLSGRHVGDVIDFPPQEARLLLAEDWAVTAQPEEREAPDLPAPQAEAQPIGDTPLTIHVQLPQNKERT